MSILPSITYSELESCGVIENLKKIFTLAVKTQGSILSYPCSELLNVLMKVNKNFDSYKQLLNIKPHKFDPVPPEAKKTRKSSKSAKESDRKFSFSFVSSIPDENRSKIIIINGKPDFPFDLNVDIPILEYLRKTSSIMRYKKPNDTSGDLPEAPIDIKYEEISETLDMKCIIKQKDYFKYLIPSIKNNEPEEKTPEIKVQKKREPPKFRKESKSTTSNLKTLSASSMLQKKHASIRLPPKIK